jgi:hypothetical protein
MICTLNLSPNCIKESDNCILFSGKNKPRCSVCIKHKISVRNKIIYQTVIKPKRPIRAPNSWGRQRGTKIIIIDGKRRAIAPTTDINTT